MEEKIPRELSRLIGCILILSSLLVFIQCKESKDSGITVYSSSQDG